MSRFNPKTNEFKEYALKNTGAHIDEQEHSYTIFSDKHGDIWVGTNINLYRLTAKDSSRQDFSISNLENHGYKHSGPIFSFCEDNQENLWLGTINGLYRYNYKTLQFKLYQHNPNDPKSLSNNSIGDIILDKKNRLWILSDGGGINLYDHESDTFSQFQANEYVLGSFKNDSIRRAFVASDGEIWLGYHPHGISVTNIYDRYLTTYVHNPYNVNSLSNNTIHALDQDSTDNLWIGTENGLNKLNLESGNVIRYLHDKHDPNSLNTKTVLSVHVDIEDEVWIGTWGGGLNQLTPRTGKFSHHKKNAFIETSIPEDGVFSIMEVEKNKLLVGAGNNLAILDKKSNQFGKIKNHDSGTDIFKRFGQKILIKDYHTVKILDPTNLNFISNSVFSNFNQKILGLDVTPNGTIWLSTESGVYKKNPEMYRFDSIMPLETDNSQYYNQIVATSPNRIWLGSSTGISNLNVKTRELLSINSNYGIPRGGFSSAKSAIKLADGKVAFGGTSGLVIVDPQISDFIHPKIKPIFTELRVLDKVIDYYSDDSPLLSPIENAKNITLTFDQNIFTIEYSTLNFQTPTETQFQIRLQGFDRGWRNMQDNRSATFTNLDPGKYTFQIKARSNIGHWESSTESIDILVLPPWWLTWQAYIFYFLFTLTFTRV